jgi:serine/threonine-protein kinase
MSPEQASGRPVDFRSDQFSFGLIAYEMLAGRRAFSRPTAVQTLAAIIGEEPAPLASIRSDTPPALDAVIARCLAKRPEDRFASTRELVVALEFLGTGASAVSIAPPQPQAEPAPSPPVAVERRKVRRPVLFVGIVVALALAGVAAWKRFAASRSIESLAILPFAASDANAEYLGDGLTENLIEQMSGVPALKVMARATVYRFKGTTDPQDAGRKLGVRAVLTGSVARRDNDLSIEAELLDASSGARLWGEKYDRPLADLLTVQDAIAAAVSDGLRLRLSDDERRALSLHGTRDPEAYELALRARHFFQQETEEGNLEARKLFEQAAEKDPKFVEAHLGIAATYAAMAVNGWAAPSEAWPRQAEEVAKALALEPGNVLARAVLAHRRLYFDWNWSYCEGEYRQLATEARLLRTDIFRPIPLYYWARGRNDEAITVMDRALRIDPGNVVSRMMRANFLTHAGKLDDAIVEYRSIAESDSSNPEAFYGLAEALRRKGEVGDAIAALRKAYELSGEEESARPLSAAKTDADYAGAESAVARARLDELEQLARGRYVSPLDLARLQAQSGEAEKAFATLGAALAERSPGLVYLEVDRAWDQIRDDPRFATVVRRVGIP